MSSRTVLPFNLICFIRMERQSEDEDWQLTIIGERNVGKTSLIRSYRTGQFDVNDLIVDNLRYLMTRNICN